MTRLVIDGSRTSRRKASTGSFSVGFRPSVATQTCSCFNLPSLLRRRKGLLSRLCGICGRYANPSEKMRNQGLRSEEHTSELQSLMRISYAVFCLKKKKKQTYFKATRQASKDCIHNMHTIYNYQNSAYTKCCHIL